MKVFRVVLFIFVVLFLLIRNFHLTDEVISEDTTSYQCDEFFDEDTVQQVIAHQRSWLEYTWNNYYCTNYKMSFREADESYSFRDHMHIDDNLDDMGFWRAIYAQLYDHDKRKLTELQDSLKRIGEAQNLDRGEFARLVVAFVQDIPYNYINPKKCDENPAHPCTPNVRFGILSPTEFLYTLRGDCDTRTVLLYTMLRNFGYEPLILNSKEYKHSMLALDIPASGDDFTFKGKRYAYWETTNVGWLPGMLPPDMNNENYWTIALDYEYKTDTTGVY